MSKALEMNLLLMENPFSLMENNLIAAQYLIKDKSFQEAHYRNFSYCSQHNILEALKKFISFPKMKSDLIILTNSSSNNLPVTRSFMKLLVIQFINNSLQQHVECPSRNSKFQSMASAWVVIKLCSWLSNMRNCRSSANSSIALLESCN